MSREPPTSSQSHVPDRTSPAGQHKSGQSWRSTKWHSLAGFLPRPILDTLREVPLIDGGRYTGKLTRCPGRLAYDQAHPLGCECELILILPFLPPLIGYLSCGGFRRSVLDGADLTCGAILPPASIDCASRAAFTIAEGGSFKSRSRHHAARGYTLPGN
jgi:hypothetical protein